MNQVFHPRLRRVVTALAAPALLLPIAVASASAYAPRPPESKPSIQPPPPAAAKADRDGDKVFDDLEARLAATPAGAGLGVIVKLSVPASRARVAELSQRMGGFETIDRFSIVPAFAAEVNQGQARALARVPWVEHVEENSKVQASNDGAQASFGVAKARADAPSLDGDGDGSAAAYSPADLVAAVIDTGIDAGHGDLDEGKVLAFKDFVNGRTSPYDDNGHGTHVAATIAGEGDARADGAYKGVAPGAALVGVKVLDANGGGTMANVTAAIDWVVQNKDVYGIEAINLSLGAGGCADGTDTTSQAVNNAHAAGLVVAVAAGNSGPGTCTIGSPGAAAHALTVGAMADTAAGGFGQASFSSRGPTADGRIKPDVSAPGVAIASAQAGTTNGYVTYDGTSMATPFVAGVALLMRDANAGLTPQHVKDAITTTAVDWARGGDNRTAGSTGPDIDYGAGRLDAYAALAKAGAPLTAAPPAPKHDLYGGTLSATGAAVDYKLSVGDTTSPLAATLLIPAISGASASSPDFDLYLYDPAGSLVARAETVSRQEAISYRPASTGTYTLRVRSYSGSGGYFVDVSAGLAVDTTAPTVASVSPGDGATGVAAAANVSVTFSEPMDKAATQGAFSLVRAADGTAVAGSFSWGGETMTFDPSSDLAAGGSYTAKVTTAAKDAAGNTLASERSWTFTVVAASTKTSVSPSAVTIYYGSLRSGGVSSLAADDDAYLAINSTTSGTRLTDWYGRVATVPNSASALEVTYKGKSSATCDQTVWIYNWTKARWDNLDARKSGTAEAAVTVAVGGTRADYVSGATGDGDVAVRVRCARGDSLNFYTSADLLAVAYTK
jgi:serine protease AprX